MMQQENTVIHWFRQDLRLTDNPALFEATQEQKVLPIYILDDVNSKEHMMGSASRWWLYKSLENLTNGLEGKLGLYAGNPEEVLDELISKYNITKIYWNRCYEPWRIKRDKDLKLSLENKGIEVNTYNGSLLWEPWEINKSDGTPYKVFTPYYKKGCLNAPAPRNPLPKAHIDATFSDEDNETTLEDLKLLPEINWYENMENN